MHALCQEEILHSPLQYMQCNAALQATLCFIPAALHSTPLKSIANLALCWASTVKLVSRATCCSALLIVCYIPRLLLHTAFAASMCAYLNSCASNEGPYHAMRRPLVADCYVSFRSAWGQHAQFAQPLMGTLLGDLQKLVAPGSATDVPTARRLLALCNCWTAIMRAAGPHLTFDWSGDSAILRSFM